VNLPVSAKPVNEKKQNARSVLQTKVRAGIKRSEVHSSTALLFTFHVGPLQIFCMAHVPREGDPDALVYVKTRLVGRALVETLTKDLEHWTATENGVSLGKSSQNAKDAVGKEAENGFFLGPLRIVLQADGTTELSLQERTLVDTEEDVADKWVAT